MNVIRKKKAYKSKVYSVRWDNEKLAFLLEREKGLETGQEIADFLMNNYWWQHKMPHVTAKEAPPLELKINKPTTPPKQDVPNLSPYDAYWAEIASAKTVKEIEATMKEVDKDKSIGGIWKNRLVMFAKKQSVEIDV